MYKRLWQTTAFIMVLALAISACAQATPSPTTAPTSVPPTSAPATEVPTAMATEAPTAMATEAPTEAPTSAATAAPTPLPTVPSTPQEKIAAAEAAALTAAGGSKIGGEVSFIGPWGGSEQSAFEAVFAPFENATGITVNYTGTRDVATILTTRVTAGNPPDLADFSTPGLLMQFQSLGALQDLSKVLDMTQIGNQYASTWVDLGTYGGEFVAQIFKVSTKGDIWYAPKVWTADNLQIPATWDDMITLSNNLISQGYTPWCMALSSGSASGWPGTDWLEDIVLRQGGLDVYNQWWQGTIKWTSPEITQAWQTWGTIAGNPAMLFGGVNRTLSTPFQNDADPLYTDPPGCYMDHQGSFMSGFISADYPDLVAGEDYNFFSFPPFSASAPSSLEVGGDLLGQFTDTPQAQAFMRYLSTAEAQDIWALIGGGYLSANLQIPPTDYPDVLSQKSGQQLLDAKVVAFDASDNMPPAMTNAFYSAVLDFIQTPSDLTSILQNLDSVQSSSY
jgi:alpha-glucoside transport system substrate-binding protein